MIPPELSRDFRSTSIDTELKGITIPTVKLVARPEPRRSPAMTTATQTHEPVAMVYSHRGNRKHAHSTRHGTKYCNHWFNVYKCPTCGRTAALKRQPIICRGA